MPIGCNVTELTNQSLQLRNECSEVFRRNHKLLCLHFDILRCIVNDKREFSRYITQKSLINYFARGNNAKQDVRFNHRSVFNTSNLPSLCSTCTKQKFKIGGINRLFSLIQLIRPLPHNLTVTILRLYHNPIFL